jgi:uncharacterized lipoprotein
MEEYMKTYIAVLVIVMTLSACSGLSTKEKRQCDALTASCERMAFKCLGMSELLEACRQQGEVVLPDGKF